MRLPLVMSILTASIFSCGPTPNFVTPNGVSFFFDHMPIDDWWSVESVVEQETWFIDELASKTDRYPISSARPAMNGVSVYVYKDPIPCPGSTLTGYCNGLQIDQFLEVRNMGCVGNSAYTHELMHWFQEKLYNTVDYNHEEKVVWPLADGEARPCR